MVLSFCYDPTFNNYAFTFKLENKQKFCGVVEKKILVCCWKKNSEDKPLSSKHTKKQMNYLL